jgi:hypothetical protein
MKTGVMKSGAMQSEAMQSEAMQSDAMQSEAMQSGGAVHEVILNGKIDLLLPQMGSNVYLLSGERWRNVECRTMREVKEIYYHYGLILWDLRRVFNKFSKESLAYTFPGIEIGEEINIANFTKKVLEQMEITLYENEILLIRYDGTIKKFCYCRFTVNKEDDFTNGAINYAKEVNGANYAQVEDSHEGSGYSNDIGCLFKVCESIPTYGADSKFTSEQNYLIDRAIDAVEKLQLTGLPLELIKRLISEEIKLSRLLITERYRIFLTDYNNREIKMGPLPKTIFLFFLKHDREFMFSDLMDYKEELLEIYEKVSNRSDKEKMLQSIETLADPTNNSICEKCTAVRKAFLEQITYNVARNYFIDGRQGMPKKIHLNRSLVEWKGKL